MNMKRPREENDECRRQNDEVKKSEKRSSARSSFIILTSALSLLCVMTSPAQQLSIRRYDVSDGLAHNTVTSIYQDKKGYLWFGTFEGLSRFDGYRFTNYSTSDGLGHIIVNHVVEDRQGRLWVATNGGGVSRLIDDPQESGVRDQGSGIRDKRQKTPDQGPRTKDQGPRTRQKFISFPVGEKPESNQVNRMLFDSHGHLWCLTDWGLYRAGAMDSQFMFKAIIVRASGDSRAMLEDQQGRLWFGLANELIEVNQNQVINHGPVGGAGRDLITGIIQDRQGRLLVASYLGLFEFILSSDSSRRGEWRQWPLKLKVNQWIHALLEDSTGAVWLGTAIGLVKYQNGQQTEYTTAQGLSVNWIRTLAEDRDGNLWIGTEPGGANKLSGEMVVSYTPADGLPDPVVSTTFEDRQGRTMAISGNSLVEIAPGRISLRRQLDSEPVSADAFMIYRETSTIWWWRALYNWPWARISQPVLRLRNGRKLALAEFGPVKAWPTYFLFYEDETGKLWFSKRESTNTQGDGSIYRVDPARPGALTVESFAADFTWIAGPLMISDRAGGLWLGDRQRLGRLWHGKSIRVEPTDGLPETDPRCFFLDSRGWLWIGMRYTGVSMTKEPGAEHPTFVNHSTAQGLSSSAVWSIAEDEFGRLYFGTDRGLDQFDPNTNRWRHYTRKDGLASDKILHLYKDRRGHIWVSTHLGLSKFNPRAERTATGPAPIYFSRVNVAGEDWPLPETGAATIPLIELAASRNNLAIEFVGLHFQGEDNLTYQYQLEGVDADWSAPAKSRAVNYARLSPGVYRFLARAITEEGVPSATPAVLDFRILPPIWQRWWFVMLATLTLGLIGYAAYRYRLAQLLKLERVRTRIATDLHDDIGASLSHIAILSEVVKRQIGLSHPGAAQTLADIATMGRELVDAMSDIVWAIDPRRDDLRNLVSRVRRFASDSLDASGIAWTFETPAELDKIKLTPEQRQHLFLIFKEAVHNIVRHADCTSASFTLSVTDNRLMAEIRDDGRGFAAPDAQVPVGPDHQGHGLYSMQARAAELGGQLQIDSAPGHGTRLILVVPLK
jgi:signal transduction histidine kinase/ligand-binding sensor domain-containing protein